MTITSLSKEQAKRVSAVSGYRGGGFFTVMLGESALWISEEYQLYQRDSDTLNDSYHLSKDRTEFIKLSDRFTIDGMVYIVKFCLECDNETKAKIAAKIHKLETEKYILD